MDPHLIIAKPLRGLESISQKIKYDLLIKHHLSTSPRIRGLVSEYIAAEFFIKQGWTLHSHRKKYYGVEIDLVLQHERGHVLLVEVKTEGSMWSSSPRFVYQQRWRFLRVMDCFFCRGKVEVRGVVAVVSQNPPEVHIIDDFL